MGYFSSLAAETIIRQRDHSYTPPEKQLLMRLEELEERYKELTGKQKQYEYRASFPASNLRYILPEHFKSATDVASAIELAIYDLAVRYSIHVREAPITTPAAVDEITGMQISFSDILSVQTCVSPLAA